MNHTNQRNHFVSPAKVLIEFFSNNIKTLDIQKFYVNNPICESIYDVLLQAIVRYRNQPSITAIKEKRNSKSRFSFTLLFTHSLYYEVNKQPKHK